MADWSMTPEDYLAEIQDWTTEYGIDMSKYISHDELTQSQLDTLRELDEKKLVWTEHGTCEDNAVSNGFTIFGDCSLTGQTSSGCGCFQSYGYYIATIPCESDFESIRVTAYLPCSVCNPDGEGEDFPEECPGPDTPELADRSECEEGFINWYFD